MRIAELAKELKITDNFINEKIKSLKLRSKDGGELTVVVEMILRDALADEGIGQKVADEPQAPKKKTVKKFKTPVDITAKEKPKTKAVDTKKDKKPKAAPA